MQKLSSLSDLASLLPESDRKQEQQSVKKGYDGKPQKLKVVHDSKGRKGKTVTLITGFQSTPAELEDIARKLKSQCGAGGGVLDNSIEIQGEHSEKVKKILTGMGFTLAK